MKTSLKVLFLCLFITLIAFSVQSSAVQVMGGTIHRLLSGLSYAESGHTGFASSGALLEITTDISTLTSDLASLTAKYDANLMVGSTTNSNTNLGIDSFKNNAGGLQSVAIGYASLYANTNGTLNTSVGNGALYTNTIGNHNSAYGDESMFYNLSGSRNTAYGWASLYTNSVSNENIAIGPSSLGFHTTGDGNIGIGYYSGLILSDNVNQNTTSSNSIYIGNNTKPLADGSVNEIVIGNSAIGNGSNTVTIGDSSIESTYLKGSVYSSGTLVAHYNGDNIASTAFALALDQEKVGISSTTVISYIATETADRIASDNLKANLDLSNVSSTTIATSIDNNKLLSLTNPEHNWSMNSNIGDIWTTATDTTSTIIYDMAYCGNGIIVAGSSADGIIYRSTDYGLTWSVASDTPVAKIYAIEYCGNGRVFAAGDTTAVLYKSTDYGLTWSSGATLGTANISAIESFGHGIVLVGNNNTGTIYRSYNWGDNWDLAVDTESSNIADIEYCGSGIALAGANDGVYKSVDWGSNWTLISSSSGSIYDMKHCGGNIIIAGTTASTIIKSVDGGVNWYEVKSITGGNTARKLAYCGNGVVITAAGNIRISTDYGDTWTVPTNGPVDTFYSILYTDNGVVLAGADAGLILRSESIYSVSDTHAKLDGSNIASTAFALALDNNVLGLSSTTVLAYIATETLNRNDAIATETSNRISSDTLKANTDGSNIASTAFSLALDQEKLGVSSTTIIAMIATETNNRISSDTLKANADGSNIASTTFTQALDQDILVSVGGGISSTTAQGYVDTHASLSANVHGYGPMTRETQLASAGQTVFTLINPYVVGNGRLFVYNNGIYQETTDYTETDANTVTFTVGIPDEASKITFVVISGSTRAARERYVATAGQTVFDLANAYVLNENRLQVLVNGLIQNVTYDYTETDTDTVTLTTGVNASDVITFIQF